MSPVSSKTVTDERSGPGGPPSTPPPPAYCSSRGSGPWNMIMSARRPHRNPGAGRLNTAQVWTDHSNSYGGRHMNVFFVVVLFCFVFFFFALKRPWYDFLASGWIFFRATWCAFNFPRGFLMSSTGCPDRGTVDCGLLTCLSSEQIPYSTIGALR